MLAACSEHHASSTRYPPEIASCHGLHDRQPLDRQLVNQATRLKFRRLLEACGDPALDVSARSRLGLVFPSKRSLD
jgi:hypothetical protein